MVQITVFFIRNGESMDEFIANAEDDDEYDKDDIPKLRLSQKVDPPLSINGYLQSAVVFTRFLKALVLETPDNNERKMAAFSAPLKSCTGTAMMMCCAGLHSQNKLRWRYTTVEAATSPTAIPIIVINGLCNQVPEINRLGGTNTVINAGLLHCAAESFNDARSKCPFMKVVSNEWKDTVQDPVKEWKNENNVDEIRRVIDVQYLRIDNINNDNSNELKNPWLLKELTPKINLIVDMDIPKKYMTPPRKGGFENKTGSNKILHNELNIGPETFIKQSISNARQIGCDTVFMFVPSTTITKIISQTINNEEHDNSIIPEACSMATIIANIDDNSTDDITGDNIFFKLHGYYTADDLMSDPTNAIPEYNGSVNVLIQPPEGCDPDSVPPNQWSKFPTPQPEVIPDDYPDLPAFGDALDELENDSDQDF